MTSPKDSPSSDGSQRHDENRTTHNQSINTDAGPAATGGAAPRAEPQLPHDIDESSHSQANLSVSQVDVGKQAFADETGPTQDTDKAAVTDAVYNGSVAPDRGDGPPRQ